MIGHSFDKLIIKYGKEYELYMNNPITTEDYKILKAAWGNKLKFMSIPAKAPFKTKSPKNHSTEPKWVLVYSRENDDKNKRNGDLK